MELFWNAGRLTDLTCILFLLVMVVVTVAIGWKVKRDDRFTQAVVDLSAAANEAGH